MPDTILKWFYLAGFIAGAVIRRAHARRRKGGRVADERKAMLDTLLLGFTSVGMVVIPVLYLLTPWFDFADYWLPAWAGWTGMVAFAAALWLLWRSHEDLGGNWSPTLQISEEHSLVTDGVYRHIRHPMYAAHWLWAVAQALLLQNWIAGPAFLAFLLPLYLVRVPREEQMMLDHFGEAYRRYTYRTGRLFPRLRR